MYDDTCSCGHLHMRSRIHLSAFVTDDVLLRDTPGRPAACLLPYQFPILCVDCSDVARNGVEEVGKMSVKWKLEGKGTKRKWWVVTRARVYCTYKGYCNRDGCYNAHN